MIDEALMKKYQEPEWYLGFEVGNSCGSDCKRHADAIAVCAYPSRGFLSIGFEVKVSRSDLKHELDNPAKCEAIYQHVNEWYLVVPKGLTKDMPIPEPWGIIEYSEKGLRRKKNAQHHEAKITAGFMLGFIRGRQRIENIQIKNMEEDQRKQIQREFEWKYSMGRMKDLEKDLKNLKEQIKKVEDAVGYPLTHYCTDDYIKILKISNNINKALNGNNRWSDMDMISYNVNEIVKFGEKIKEAVKPLLEMTGRG